MLPRLGGGGFSKFLKEYYAAAQIRPWELRKVQFEVMSLPNHIFRLSNAEFEPDRLDEQRSPSHAHADA